MISMYITENDDSFINGIYAVYHDHFIKYCAYKNANNWLLDMYTDENMRVTAEYNCSLVDQKFFL